MSKHEPSDSRRLAPATVMTFMLQPLAMGLYAWSASMRHMEAVLEVQHRMLRRTALLCQHAASELLAAQSPSAALGIQSNVLIASVSDAAKLCSELSLAAAPPLPEPVVQAMVDTTPPGLTPQQVTSWTAPALSAMLSTAQEAAVQAVAPVRAAHVERRMRHRALAHARVTAAAPRPPAAVARVRCGADYSTRALE